MADSYTSKLRVRLQATGFNRNTWGALINAAALQLLEDAICGLAQVPVTTGDVTLSQNNGASDNARMAIINLTGAPTGPLNCIVPALSKLYLVINNTSQTMTVKTASGTGIAITSGANQWLACDGTNVIAPQAVSTGSVSNAANLGGIPAASYARLDIFNTFAAGNATPFNNLTDGGTITLNCLRSNSFYCLLGGNRALAISNPEDGQKIEIWLQQDGVGSRTISWPANFQFEAGSSNTLSVTPSTIDRFKLTYNLALDKWIVRSAIGFATPGTATLVISSNEQNVNIWRRAGSPGGAVTVNVTVAAGVVLQSTNTATPAIDFSGFSSGATINFTNLGYILGRGGAGGMGGQIGGSGSSITSWDNAKKGRDGGPAAKAPGSGVNFNITNGSGFIWGGGGGGGGGGAHKGTGATESNGGGGGGGAGGGPGGPEGSCGSGDSTSFDGTPGVDGSTGPTGTFGAAGTGNANGGGAGASGGAGGDWGSSGAAGTSLGSGDFYAIANVGGGPGKAIDLNGGSVVFVSGSGGPNIKGAVS